VKDRFPENLAPDYRALKSLLPDLSTRVIFVLPLSYPCLTPVLPIMGGNMETTRLSNKGQIVIPKQVRATHGWEPGLEFIVEDTGDGIKLKPVTPYLETKAEELLGCVGYNGPKKSLKEMEAAIAKGARKKI
jgi:AbrB family looped-hinge helix DNA binding protein